MFRALLSLFALLILMISSWIGPVLNQSAIAQIMIRQPLSDTYLLSDVLRNPVDEKLGEIGTKVDLNNSSVLIFKKYRGLYPSLARKIIDNAPFDAVEDVLKMPNLSNREVDILKDNLANFIVTPPEPALVEGGDRINPGVYK